jgi:hypothetical protein
VPQVSGKSDVLARVMLTHVTVSCKRGCVCMERRWVQRGFLRAGKALQDLGPCIISYELTMDEIGLSNPSPSVTLVLVLEDFPKSITKTSGKSEVITKVRFSN